MSFLQKTVHTPAFLSSAFVHRQIVDHFLGQWKADVGIPQITSLEQSETFLEGTNKVMFLNFMRGMLQWRPEERKTAKQLLEDPWLNDQEL